jgi:FKBP-type peptidyl-prolyl cis-trans isomerase SlyD
MNAQIISFNCTLKNKAGVFISFTYNREVLTVSGIEPDGVLSGLNKNLLNLKKGDKRVITLRAEEAYGFYDPKKVILFPRRKLPKSVRKGELLHIVGKSGVQRSYRVLELHSDLASLDGNHPLAGQDLIFEIEALDARAATPEEVASSLNMVSQQLLH